MSREVNWTETRGDAQVPVEDEGMVYTYWVTVHMLNHIPDRKVIKARFSNSGSVHNIRWIDVITDEEYTVWDILAFAVCDDLPAPSDAEPRQPEAEVEEEVEEPKGFLTKLLDKFMIGGPYGKQR